MSLVYDIGMNRGNRHLVVVRDNPDGLPVGYASWAEWRFGCREPGEMSLGPVGQPCPLCWGQRKIWEPGPLGLLPVLCENCAGTGRSV